MFRDKKTKQLSKLAADGAPGVAGVVFSNSSPAVANLSAVLQSTRLGSMTLRNAI